MDVHETGQFVADYDRLVAAAFLVGPMHTLRFPVCPVDVLHAHRYAVRVKQMVRHQSPIRPIKVAAFDRLSNKNILVNLCYRRG